jgi:hypothetical protein
VVKPLLYAAGGIGLLALAYFAASAPTSPEIQVRTRKVGFDNLYGGVDRLVVHFKLDDQAEQTATANCDAKTCIFDLLLLNGRHELELSVELNGKRSTTTRVTLDTSALP